LLQIIDEKDRELVYKCKQLQEQESKLTDVNKQLIEEKGRVDATKSLLKKEIAKRKKLINEAVPTEQEIDRELEE
jgi:septal ring factor EnvC (AmiA/AmiB activator)